MLSKRKQTDTTLKPIESIGIKSDSEHRIPAVLFTSLLTIITVICLSNLLFVSFGTFGSAAAGPYRAYFSNKEIRKFFFKVIIGCIPICAVNGLKKYSLPSSFGLFAMYALYFVRNYKAVSNGFVHALNKALITVTNIHGDTPDIYYISDFAVTDPKAEIEIFCFAVCFGACFMLAFSAVQFSMPIMFTLCTAAFACLPMVCDILAAESSFAAAACCCIIVYVISVQGYRNGSSGRLIQGFGRIVRVNGVFVSYSAFQQAAAAALCIAAVAGVSSLFVDYSDYRKNPKAMQLGQRLMNAISDMSSMSGSGDSTANTLSGGDLSKSGNIKYNGDNMFDIMYENDIESPHYLRSFTAAAYGDNRWEDFGSNVYADYADMWGGLAAERFMPQMMYGDFLADYTPYSDFENAVTLRYDKLSRKTLLTDTKIITLGDETLAKTEYNFDEYPYFGLFASTGKQYSQHFADIDSDLVNIDYDTHDGLAHNLYNILHDGDFFTDTFMYSLSSYSDSSYESPQDISEYLAMEKQYRQFVMENYLACPDNVFDYVPKRFGDMQENFFYSYYGDINYVTDYDLVTNYYNYVIMEVQQYLADHAEYTLTPGVLPEGRDFTEYFLNENHEGYCVHFATAGALMLRCAGIPTRYAEGFYIGTDDVQPSEDGYAHIPDSNAHAWAEVYFPMIGWQAVEFTPSYTKRGVPDENKNYSDTSDEDTEEFSDTDSVSDTETETQSDIESDIPDSEAAESAAESSDTDDSFISDIPIFSDDDGDGGLRLFHVIIIGIGYVLYYTLKLVLWLVLRWLFMKLREKRFTEDNTRISARALYKHSLFLLRVAGVKPEPKEGDMEFARRAMHKINDVYSKEYEEFTQYALDSRFGREPIPRESTDKMIDFVNKLSKSIYDDSGKIKQFVIKYVLFLI